jgi:hypothetical protein
MLTSALSSCSSIRSFSAVCDCLVGYQQSHGKLRLLLQGPQRIIRYGCCCACVSCEYLGHATLALRGCCCVPDPAVSLQVHAKYVHTLENQRSMHKCHTSVGM